MKDVREQLAEWLTFLEDQVISLRTNQHIFWELQKIIKSNPNISKPNHFYGWVAEMYAAAMSVAVRKLTDNDRRVISFRRFLQRLQANPGVGRYPVDPANLATQIAKLEATTAGLKNFVDKRIAHHEGRDFKEIPTFKELDDSIAYLDELVVEYSPLFTGMALHNTLPVWQYDWKEIFYHPWIDECTKR